MGTQQQDVRNAIEKFCRDKGIPYPTDKNLLERILAAKERYARESIREIPAAHSTHRKRREREVKRLQRAWNKTSTDTRRLLASAGCLAGCDLQKYLDKVIPMYHELESARPQKGIDSAKRHCLLSLGFIFKEMHSEGPSAREGGLFDVFCGDVCRLHFGVKARRGAINDGSLYVRDDEPDDGEDISPVVLKRPVRKSVCRRKSQYRRR